MTQNTPEQLMAAGADPDKQMLVVERPDRADLASVDAPPVVAINPDHPQPHFFLGLILMREGANEEATQRLERFLQLAPDHPDAGMAQGVLQYLKGS